MNKILTILAALAELLTRFFRLKEQRDHEKQQDEIKKDPAGWLDGHFNGDDNSVHPNEPMPHNADPAKQTTPKKHSKNK